MLTVRHNGMTAAARFLATACFAALLPQPLLSKAWKESAGIDTAQTHRRLRG